MPKCSQCRFWDRKTDKGGLCRKRAPYATAWQDKRDGEYISAVWPWTSHDEWCGDFVEAVGRNEV